MKSILLLASVLYLFVSCNNCSGKNGPAVYPDKPEGPARTDVSAWITSPQAGILFKQQISSLIFESSTNAEAIIEVDTAQVFQEIDGFGNCLTGGSAILLNGMESSSRKALLTELFASDGANIGISYLRISIGASDLSDRVFSYNDLPAGQTDPDMARFTIEMEKKDMIPVLKEILNINPTIKILGSPWSPPVWMKTNQNSKGGSLKPEYYDAYALYFVKYIQAMKAEGINIDAITIQNEPLHPGNQPSMLMLANEQADFIKRSLGPAFKKASLSTKIIVYDHNADRPDYPMTLLNDPEVAKYVDGSAFHLYSGTIDALSTVHNAFPLKNLYFTEQWIGSPGHLPEDLAWHIRTLIIGATRNWSRNVLEWNLAADSGNDPHTVGGCDQCLGTVTVSGNSFVRNPAYYILAHAAKFVRPGSFRIHSNLPDGLPNVAFVTPNQQKVLIVLNDSGNQKKFNLKFKGKIVKIQLDKGSVGTFVWQ
jgi:glucosylceramidase